MTIATPIRSDHEIQTAVTDELEWTPEVNSAGIGVAVTSGIVALSGEVAEYSELLAAKHAALRVRGVIALVDDLIVHRNAQWTFTETDVAKEVQHALKWASNVPESVQAEVRDHAVILTGAVSWDYQREASKRAVEHLRGVLTVSDQITLTERPSAADTETRIGQALARNAQLDARSITVTVSGSKVTLSGSARSWSEKREAAIAAWASPNVTSVDNQILVRAY